jgi:hypothetical protein
MNELTNLQQALSTNISDTTNAAISDTMNQLISWTLIPSLIFLGLFLLLYIIRSVHRHKVDKAVFEIRDMLREMRAEKSDVTTTPADPLEIK